MSPLSPCFIITVIITAEGLMQTKYKIRVFGLDGRHAICTHYRKRERDAVHLVLFCQLALSLSLGSWLIYNCRLISHRERAEAAASGQPGSYLHYCRLSLLPLSQRHAHFLLLCLIFVSFSCSLLISIFLFLSLLFVCLSLYLSLNLMF